MPGMVGAVAQAFQVEEKLPGAPGILAASLGWRRHRLARGLWVRRWVGHQHWGPRSTLPGKGNQSPGTPQARQCWEGTGPHSFLGRAHECLPRAKLSAQLSSHSGLGRGVMGRPERKREGRL